MVTTHKYYLENKEHIKASNKAWILNNLEKRKAYCKSYGKIWRERNKEKHLSKLKEWRKLNPNKVKTQNKKWYEEHKEQRKLYSKEWTINNRKHVNNRTNNYYKKRLAKDIKFKLLVYARIRINSLFKNKSKKTKELLGYTIEELKTHIENKFQNGMNWENYGRCGWHIDHIKPLSKIIINGNDSEIKEAYKLENLQPLWAEDNFRKNNKY